MRKIFLLFIILFFFSSCDQQDKTDEVPILTVEESLKDFEIEKGFVIEPVCAEPLVEDPVALCFDENASMWVVEMRGYMNDKEGGGENMPLGRIKVITDNNADGNYDSSYVFLDSLIMPRAVNVVKGGILLIEPPGLFFIENINGKAGRRITIDSAFAETGNPEHQPNGLMRAMDNWYYCTSSDKRVKNINGNWIVEITRRRGQWGLSMNDAGQLFYNNNSVMLMADNFLPGSFPVNKNHRLITRKISNVQIASNRVYPRRETLGINRGYQKGALDKEGKLVNVTSACGPVIYRGDNFPKEFYGNAFVMEPVAYLVKRILVSTDENGLVKGKFADPDKEFLTATDERFRPVNAYTSPDGCIYIIDMHRGVIQHTTYMTPYLRRHIDSLNLQRPIGMGRIYRIRWKEKTASKPLQLSSMSADELAGLLKHPNGFYRDMAQRLLIEKNDLSILEKLKNFITDRSDPVAALHALWTLEGMDKLTPELIKLAANTHENNFFIYQSCLQLLAESNDKPSAFETLLTLRKKGNRLAEVCFINSLSRFSENYFKQTDPILSEIISIYKNDSLVTDAMVSSLTGKEKFFLNKIAGSGDTVLIKALNTAIKRSEQPDETANLAHLSKAEKERYNSGRSLFINYCSACHGKEGDGIINIAPPLAGSEWVTATDPEIPIKIVLDGLTGPVIVNGETYSAPSYANAMPGLRNNIETNNGEMAAILTYIRNSFRNKASAVSITEVGKIRSATETRTAPYTANELKPAQ